MIFSANYALFVNIVICFFLIIRLIALAKSRLFLIVYLIIYKSIG
jgi:hypothetical protein